uniref:Uncharacterized protein n=1 Tax=Rhipicephalus zambeziensis TaxID=60191 RepID=A0A224YAQ2_9ACAR
MFTRKISDDACRIPEYTFPEHVWTGGHLVWPSHTEAHGMRDVSTVIRASLNNICEELGEERSSLAVRERVRKRRSEVRLQRDVHCFPFYCYSVI